jgi:hypothetical protein
MAEIYSRARSVQIWLGPSDASTQYIFQDFRYGEIMVNALAGLGPMGTENQDVQAMDEHVREFADLIKPGPEGICSS